VIEEGLGLLLKVVNVGQGTAFEGGSERPDTDRSEAPDIPSLLHWATKLDRPDVIRALVDCRVNSNALNETGTTAVVYAIELGRFKCVDVLLSLSTKVEGEFYGRRTPLSVATEFRRDDILKLLIEKGASFYHIDDLLGD
jgi:ankyrin repeat protein